MIDLLFDMYKYELLTCSTSFTTWSIKDIMHLNIHVCYWHILLHKSSWYHLEFKWFWTTFPLWRQVQWKTFNVYEAPPHSWDLRCFLQNCIATRYRNHPIIWLCIKWDFNSEETTLSCGNKDLQMGEYSWNVCCRHSYSMVSFKEWHHHYGNWTTSRDEFRRIQRVQSVIELWRFHGTLSLICISKNILGFYKNLSLQGQNGRYVLSTHDDQVMLVTVSGMKACLCK